MALSERVSKLNPSSTLQITSLAKKLSAQGIDVVSFSAGEPDFDTPDFIKDAAVKAIQSGFTKYTPSTGIPELKKAIQDKFQKDNNLNYSTEQIVVSCGAKHCLFNIILALVNPADEVIIPSPYWVSYTEMVTCAQGVSKIVRTNKKGGFKITSKQLNAAVSKKTKILVLNSPSNPTGVVYSKEELEPLAKICVENNIYVISDEIYEKLIYDGLIHSSIAGLNEDIFKLTFVVNGVSKAYSMTGWRIGYLAGPLEIVRGISNLQDHSTSNPCSIAQKAALCGLTEDKGSVSRMRIEFEKRRDHLMKRIDKMPLLSYIRPQGAFYLFCDISKTKLKSQELSNRLLKEANVAVIPGEGFGWPDYIRLSFATSIQSIDKGIDRIEKWLGKI